MPTIQYITIKELQNLLRSLQLPPDIRFTVTFEDDEAVKKVLKRQLAIAAMKKLRGSGNGNLVAALLTEREKDASL